MTTTDLKSRLQEMYPKAEKIRVRQYPATYKGSMRWYTTININGGGYEYRTTKDKILSIVPEPSKTFVDVINF